MSVKIINVLYVDDESHNLKSFIGSFRRDFNVFIALSAREAENILSIKQIHILITDQRMPVKLGTELLADAVKKYPEQIRIILTAFADDEAVKYAIKKELIFAALEKPWNEEELRTAIEKGYEMYIWENEKRKANDEVQISNEEINLALKQKGDSK
jgi:response regulator RpfG family c-di-GMP phosphodiesterase